MKSKYEDTNRVGDGSWRHCDGITSIAALRRCSQMCLALAAIAALMVALMPAQSRAQQKITFADSARRAIVTVAMGKTEDVHTAQSVVDITVGDADIADVTPLTDHSLSILGKKIGTTRVTAYGEGKKIVGIFDVEVSYDVSRLAVEIARFSGGGIKVASVNGRIMLNGTAPDAVTLDKAVMIGRQFDKDLINAVQVMQQQQVMLEVRFIEVDRRASRELGVQWNMFGGSAIANIGDQLPASKLPITQAASVTAAGLLSGTAPFGFLIGQLGNRLQVAVNALEQRGLARSLAEPNLVALSGDTASFLAGGQFYVPAASSTGTPSFTPQQYGVGLSFTPTVLKDGVINLVIKPEVSEIDPTTTVTIAGISVPGLIVRKASTTLELRDGQSFMLGGLLQNKSQAPTQQLPWLGDLPVLGTLFRSSSYQKDETDLVILVTPHTVRPLRPTDTAHTPLDNTLPPNDVDFFLMGQAEVSPALVRLAAGAVNRPYVGHILDLPKKGGVYVSVRD